MRFQCNKIKLANWIFHSNLSIFIGLFFFLALFVYGAFIDCYVDKINSLLNNKLYLDILSSLEGVAPSLAMIVI